MASLLLTLFLHRRFRLNFQLCLGRRLLWSLGWFFLFFCFFFDLLFLWSLLFLRGLNLFWSFLLFSRFSFSWSLFLLLVFLYSLFFLLIVFGSFFLFRNLKLLLFWLWRIVLVLTAFLIFFLIGSFLNYWSWFFFLFFDQWDWNLLIRFIFLLDVTVLVLRNYSRSFGRRWLWSRFEFLEFFFNFEIWVFLFIFFNFCDQLIIFLSQNSNFFFNRMTFTFFFLFGNISISNFRILLPLQFFFFSIELLILFGQRSVLGNKFVPKLISLMHCLDFKLHFFNDWAWNQSISFVFFILSF